MTDEELKKRVNTPRLRMLRQSTTETWEDGGRVCHYEGTSLGGATVRARGDTWDEVWNRLPDWLRPGDWP